MTVELRRVARTAARLARVKQDRDEAIRGAVLAGHSARAVAAAAGVSHPTVLAITKHGKEATGTGV